MNEDEILKAAENANMIVYGYTFTKTKDNYIRVLNIRPPFHALVMSPDGDVYETSMDDIELSIVLGYWAKNKKYMEENAYAEGLEFHGLWLLALFVKSDGSTVVITPGQLTDKELRIVRAFIKDNYKEMYIKWSEMSNEGFYRGK